MGGGQPLTVPLHCCLRVYHGWTGMTLRLMPVSSHLSFICAVDVPTMEVKRPSFFSRSLTVAWSGPLLLLLNGQEKTILNIDLPTSISIPIRERMTCNSFLRNPRNDFILDLLCTQSGRVLQLSSPTRSQTLSCTVYV